MQNLRYRSDNLQSEKNNMTIIFQLFFFLENITLAVVVPSFSLTR
ncbi:Protein CBG27498 [Caenorhabditis briggsae]|uniref:Protein CBG27498 n=1 Tax=Caenorhabditis briggsae TaxID=6238 RepID=B6IF13_CAEBR|nr:Protein CBG27498 [Caenorhabditis briggsae]CAR98493.1 Protein CBG27498 [Caenorhabditis briggsae]